VYDGSSHAQPLLEADLPQHGKCGNLPCWRGAGRTTFRYKNPFASPDGMTSAKLKSGVAGKSRIQVMGKGNNLQAPALGLTLPVTVQLLIGDGNSTRCWQTTYTTARINGGARFNAKGP
jgi:hypothetical protein